MKNIDYMLERLRNAKSVRKQAELKTQLNDISFDDVCLIAHEHGIEIPTKWHKSSIPTPKIKGAKSTLDLTRMLQLYEQGLNDGEISKQMNVRNGSVYSWRARNGLPANANRGYHGKVEIKNA